LDYVLLSPEEAAELLNLSAKEVVDLVETGELGGLRVAGHWRIPLKSIAHLLSEGMKAQNVRALERVFNDHATWKRVFGAHPEVTQLIEEGAFPYGTVGAYLKEAISIARSQRAGSVGPESSHGGDQDASYQVQSVGKSGAG
jgi:excisionase family DNA binding protein